MGYWKTKVVPKIKTTFNFSSKKGSGASDASCKAFHGSKEEVSRQIEEKEEELRPKLLEIYEASSEELKTAVRKPTEDWVKKNSNAALINKFLEDLVKIDFPGSKQACEASSKYTPAQVSSSVIFIFGKVAAILPPVGEAPSTSVEEVKKGAEGLEAEEVAISAVDVVKEAIAKIGETSEKLEHVVAVPEIPPKAEVTEEEEEADFPKAEVTEEEGEEEIVPPKAVPEDEAKEELAAKVDDDMKPKALEGEANVEMPKAEPTKEEEEPAAKVEPAASMVVEMPKEEPAAKVEPAASMVVEMPKEEPAAQVEPAASMAVEIANAEPTKKEAAAAAKEEVAEAAPKVVEMPKAEATAEKVELVAPIVVEVPKEEAGAPNVVGKTKAEATKGEAAEVEMPKVVEKPKEEPSTAE